MFYQIRAQPLIIGSLCLVEMMYNPDVNIMIDFINHPTEACLSFELHIKNLKSCDLSLSLILEASLIT